MFQLIQSCKFSFDPCVFPSAAVGLLAEEKIQCWTPLEILSIINMKYELCGEFS